MAKNMKKTLNFEGVDGSRNNNDTLMAIFVALVYDISPAVRRTTS